MVERAKPLEAASKYHPGNRAEATVQVVEELDLFSAPRSHGRGEPFIELSRVSAIRIATAVTRPTIVASSG